MSCQSCSFNYYSCIVQFFGNDRKSMEFLRSHGVLLTTVTCFYCKSLRNYRKLDVVEKVLVCQNPRKQGAALPFRTLKALFYRIPIFHLRKLSYLLTTTSAITGTTGLRWNAVAFL